jgi:hypothetical protein
MMNRPTKAVLRFMLAQDETETRETCLEWLEGADGDRDAAEIAFAGKLAEDLEAPAVADRCDPETKLAAALAEHALGQVNFRSVARALMERFAPRRRAFRPAVVPSVN